MRKIWLVESLWEGEMEWEPYEAFLSERKAKECAKAANAEFGKDGERYRVQGYVSVD